MQLLADAPQAAAWGRLLSRVEEAVLQEYIDSIPEMPAARLALETAFAAADNREAHWLTHRLLWAMPWPASVVPAAARAIGGIFDETVLSRHASRPLADTWIAWASRWTQLLAPAMRSCYGPAPTRETSLTELRHHGQAQVTATPSHVPPRLPLPVPT